jgi:hypothetical protein
MAEIKTIDMSNDKIEVKLSVNRDEYKILKHHMTDLAILPKGADCLKYQLTTGKLGNSNRIMLPKKMLENFNIRSLDKKVPTNIFIIEDDAYLLIKIKKSEFGIPKFVEDG